MTLAGATLRVARSTGRMDEVTAFYVDGLALERLAAFEDHAGFDGVVLGARNAPYHLEFTRRRGRPSRAAPDPETLLVFYLPDGAEWRAAVERLRALGSKPVASHNPYWDSSGLTFEDPDGFRIVLQNAAWPL
ncbi:VOC family protein [Phenylobacterium sp.]|uniref:VOC family protein n=1 Tax=Phenylobacterium sp. TaxID=1871053 RepID=UPI003567B009